MKINKENRSRTSIRVLDKYLYSTDSIHVVIVTYCPDCNILASELNALFHQVDIIWIIDNSQNDCFSKWLSSEVWPQSVQYISMNGNQGIGAAQNKGISLAKAAGADYVLLMDQDSLPATDMVSVMLEQAKKKSNVAAVGPIYQDVRRVQQQLDSGGLDSIRTAKERSSTLDSKVKSHLIASGCLIPIEALDKVGFMREDLFIDYVDTEWCLRAQKKGLLCYQIPSAKMKHSLGDEPIHFLWRTVASHSSLRHYYQYRNAILLYKDPLLPLAWKITDASRMILKFFFFVLYAKPRGSHIKMMLLGIQHGLKGVCGKYEIIA